MKQGNEAVEVLRADEPPRLGRIAVLDQDMMVIEVLESTIGLDLHNTRVRFASRHNQRCSKGSQVRLTRGLTRTKPSDLSTGHP